MHQNNKVHLDLTLLGINFLRIGLFSVKIFFGAKNSEFLSFLLSHNFPHTFLSMPNRKNGRHPSYDAIKLYNLLHKKASKKVGLMETIEYL